MVRARPHVKEREADTSHGDWCGGEPDVMNKKYKGWVFTNKAQRRWHKRTSVRLNGPEAASWEEHNHLAEEKTRGLRRHQVLWQTIESETVSLRTEQHPPEACTLLNNACIQLTPAIEDQREGWKGSRFTFILMLLTRGQVQYKWHWSFSILL